MEAADGHEYNALHLAAYRGNKEIVREIIQAIPEDSRSRFVAFENGQNETAVDVARRMEKTDIVEVRLLCVLPCICVSNPRFFVIVS